MRRATCRAPEGVRLQTKAGDRPMKETITSFVGLDVHKDSIAIAVAEAGRQAPRFIGTVVPSLPSLRRALRSIGRASDTLLARAAAADQTLQTSAHRTQAAAKQSLCSRRTRVVRFYLGHRPT